MAKSSSEKINWTTGLLNETFNLINTDKTFHLLVDWLDTDKNDLSESDILYLEEFRFELEKFGQYWNEETLKMRFIAFLLHRVNYNLGKLQGIFEAEVSALVETHNLKVVTDFTVASVNADLIKNPYFNFHEYKSKVKKVKDPLSQVLVAMLIAQELNKNGKPMYGCYVFGEDWHFMVLHGKTYAIAEKLTATKSADIQQILLVLRKFKHILLTELAVD